MKQVGILRKPVLDLPKLGIISNPLDGDVFGRYSELHGKDVLCLGISEDQVDRFITPHNPNSVTLLTYWQDHVDSQSSRYPLTFGDITHRTDFSDKCFDVVLSMSVLEHVSDVDAALAEMARIAKSETAHIFGPAWSCAYGHHLCTGISDVLEMNFYHWTLPAHMHLLCPERELCDFYESLGLTRDHGSSVYYEFHENDHINRLFYDDYVTALNKFQITNSAIMYNRLPDDHLVRLRRQFPHRTDFSTYGGYFRLVV